MMGLIHATKARPVRIAPLRAGDFERALELFALLGPRYAALRTDPRAREVYELYVAQDHKIGLGAFVERDGKSHLDGVILFEVTPVLGPELAHARGDGMAVDPAQRGLGLGGRLLDAALAEASRRGARLFMAKASAPEVIAWYRRKPELAERGVYFYYEPNPLPTVGLGLDASGR
jgi:ribosomal protein S18 acetylase RimI-like enzyme